MGTSPRSGSAALLFAGVSLEGATLRPGRQANEKIYGPPVDPKQVLASEVAAPSGVQPLVDTLTKYSRVRHR